jgi:hypothetical protein
MQARNKKAPRLSARKAQESEPGAEFMHEESVNCLICDGNPSLGKCGGTTVESRAFHAKFLL